MITDAGMRPRFYEKEQDMQKNDIVTADIEDIGVNGEGIGKVDGYTLFIKDALPPESAPFSRCVQLTAYMPLAVLARQMAVHAGTLSACRVYRTKNSRNPVS